MMSYNMVNKQSKGLLNNIKVILRGLFYSDFHLFLIYMFYIYIILAIYFFITAKKLIFFAYIFFAMGILQCGFLFIYDNRFKNLQKRNYLLSNCFDSLPSLFLILDKDWKVVFANDIFQAFSIGKNLDSFEDVLESFSENEDLYNLLKKGQESLGKEQHFSEVIKIDDTKSWKIYMGLLKKSYKNFYVCYISDVQEDINSHETNQELILNEFPEGILIFNHKKITYINNTLLNIMKNNNMTEEGIIDDLKRFSNKKNFIVSYKSDKDKILLKFEKIKEGDLLVYKVWINSNILKNMSIYNEDNCLLGVLLIDNEFNIIDTNNKFNNFVNSYFVRKTNFLQYVESNKHNFLKHYLKEKTSKDIPPIVITLGEKGGHSVLLHGDNLDNNGWLIFLQDNSAYADLEIQLLHAQRLSVLGQVLTSVSHDFNNILTAISGFCDMLCLKIPIIDEKYFSVVQIKHNINRAINLVKYMLYLSKKTIPELESNTDLNDITSSLISNMGRLLGENIQINFIKSEKDISVKLPSINLEQILLNLIVNGRDAMKNGGVITITTNLISDVNIIDNRHELTESGPYVELSVTDTGEGISESNKKKIFDSFFTTKKEGTGLGLSTIQAIVRQYKGTIQLISKIGVGTTFKIYLPATEILTKDPTNKEKVMGNENYKKNDKKTPINLVLVEDDISIRNLLQEGLKKKTYLNVYAFKSLKESTEYINTMIKENQSIDLVISDIMISDGNGLELVTKIKKINNKTKFILISGYDKEHLESLKNYDVLQKYNQDIIFLQKPFSIQEMLVLIESFYEKITG
jgi:signal transduction histidine kinase/CheY-like chemotaxis protein